MERREGQNKGGGGGVEGGRKKWEEREGRGGKEAVEEMREG